MNKEYRNIGYDSSEKEIRAAYVESNSDYKEAFGKLDGEQRKKLLLHPQVYIFSDGGTITWLGSKYVTDKMISINFFGAVDELGTVEILDI